MRAYGPNQILAVSLPYCALLAGSRCARWWIAAAGSF